MKKNTQIAETGVAFEEWAEALRQGESVAWQQFILLLNQKLMPWLKQKAMTPPKESVISKADLVEEAFTETLLFVHKNFATGTFANLAAVRGWCFKIANFKLHEAWRKVKLQQHLYFTDDWNGIIKEEITLNAADVKEQQMAEQVKQYIKTLEKMDQEILVAFANGEAFNEIADEFGLTAANCRKRKQRAIEKIKRLFVYFYLFLKFFYT